MDGDSRAQSSTVRSALANEREGFGRGGDEHDPGQQATFNFKTAKTLGLTIPPGVLAIADEVIDWRFGRRAALGHKRTNRQHQLRVCLFSLNRLQSAAKLLPRRAV